jgi:hypothetical protein
MEYKTTENSSQSTESADHSNVLTTQIQKEVQHIEKCLKNEYKRIENLTTQLQLTSQQIQLFTKESKITQEDLKDCNWKISKEMCIELRKVACPSQVLVEVCEKVMTVLGQSPKTFSEFRNLTKNFNLFKNMMSGVQTRSLSEEVINEILPIWKSQDFIQNKLIKISKCGCLLARWIYLVVDINIKTETINSSKKREPELEKKIRESQKICKNFEKHLETLQETLSEKNNKSEGTFENAHEEFTQKFQFLEDLDLQKKEIVDENFSFRNLVKFPDFQDDKLYDERSLRIPEIVLEGVTEEIGCCKLNFFCF